MQLPSQSLDIQQKRVEIVDDGLKGWTDTLKFYKDLTQRAEQFPLKASEIFSSDVTGDGARKNRLINDANMAAAENQAALTETGLAVSDSMPTSGTNGGDMATQ